MAGSVNAMPSQPRCFRSGYQTRPRAAVPQPDHGQGARRGMAAAGEQAEGPWPFARMAASSLVCVSTYIFLALPCPADRGPTARPFGIVLTNPIPRGRTRNCSEAKIGEQGVFCRCLSISSFQEHSRSKWNPEPALALQPKTDVWFCALRSPGTTQGLCSPESRIRYWNPLLESATGNTASSAPARSRVLAAAACRSCSAAGNSHPPR